MSNQATGKPLGDLLSHRQQLESWQPSEITLKYMIQLLNHTKLYNSQNDMYVNVKLANWKMETTF